MQKTSLRLAILTSLLVIVFLMQPLAQVEIVKANPYPHGLSPLQVHSPAPNPYVSTNPTVLVSFDYNVPKNQVQVDHLSYSLDESANLTLTSSMSDYSYGEFKYSVYSVSKILENLANGGHSINFYVQFLNGTVNNFWHLAITVDPTYKPPVPHMISPLNQTTYSTKDVPVTFTVNSNFVGDSLYRLDSSNASWKCLIGNGTLSDLSEGSHELKLVMYIGTQTDPQLVEYRETIYFNVGTGTSSSAPSSDPTTVPEFSWLAILPLLLLMLSVAVALRLRRKRCGVDA